MHDRALDRLFRRFRDRSDGAALAAIFDATSRELLEVACHLVRDPVEAEDVVQAAFLAAIRRADSYDGSMPLKGWLYGILWREAAKTRRRAARSVDPSRMAERREPEPIEALLALEMPEALQEALDKLPQRYREVLEPLIRDGRPAEEIARSLARPAGTVRSQIHRGMERLRRALPAAFVPVAGLGAVSLRGLAEVRATVLRAAGFSPTVAATTPALAVNLGLGTLVMSKTILVSGVAALAGVAGVWYAVAGPSVLEAGRLSGPATSVEAVAPVPRIDPQATSGELAETAPGGGRAQPASPSQGVVETPSPQADIDYWLARFNEAPDDWRHGLAVTNEVAKLSPDEALRVMTAVWPHLGPMVKEQALKPFLLHVHALRILDLAATDTALTVQGRAFTYLKNYAFQDFGNDYQAYLDWASKYRDAPLGDVLIANARELVADLLVLSPKDLADRIRGFGRLDLKAGDFVRIDLAQEMREAGALTLLAACMQLEDLKAVSLALEWSASVKVDELWLRSWVMPLIQNSPDASRRPADAELGVLQASFLALSRPECKWAREPLVEYLRRVSAIKSEGEPTYSAASIAARALAQIGDPAAVPAMIEILVNDRSGALGYDLGYHGIARMTGVKWQESYDGAWWLDWWERNRMRFPPEVQAISIQH
jgi:RNA polymerase sigma factor (sigma-70 family)